MGKSKTKVVERGIETVEVPMRSSEKYGRPSPSQKPSFVSVFEEPANRNSIPKPPMPITYPDLIVGVAQLP